MPEYTIDVFPTLDYFDKLTFTQFRDLFTPTRLRTYYRWIDTNDSPMFTDFTDDIATHYQVSFDLTRWAPPMWFQNHIGTVSYHISEYIKNNNYSDETLRRIRLRLNRPNLTWLRYLNVMSAYSTTENHASIFVSDYYNERPNEIGITYMPIEEWDRRRNEIIGSSDGDNNNSSSSTTTTTTTTTANNNNSSSSSTTTTTANNNNNNNPDPKFKVGDRVFLDNDDRLHTIKSLIWLRRQWVYILKDVGDSQFSEKIISHAEYKIDVRYMVDYHNPLELEEYKTLMYDDIVGLETKVKSGLGSSVIVTLSVNPKQWHKEFANRKPEKFFKLQLELLAQILASKFNQDKYKDIDGIKNGLTEADKAFIIPRAEMDGTLGDYAYATVSYGSYGSVAKIIVTDKLDPTSNGNVSDAKEMKKPPPKELNELEKEKKYIEKKLKRAKEKNEQLKEKKKEAREKWKMALRLEKRSDIELKSVKAWNKKLENITLDQFQELKEASRRTQMKKCRNEDIINLKPWDAEDFTNTIFLRFKMKDGKEETYTMRDGTKKPTIYCVADSRADPTIEGDKRISKDEMVFNMLFANWVEKGVGATGSKDLLHGKEGDPYDISITYKRNGIQTLREGKGGKPGNERYVKLTTVFNGAARYFRFDDKLKTIIKVKKGDGSVFYTEEDRQEGADMSRNSEIGFQLERGWKYPLAVYCEYDKTIAIGNIVASSGISETHGNRVEDVYKVVTIATFEHFEDVEDIFKFQKPDDNSGSSSSTSGAKRKNPGLKF